MKEFITMFKLAKDGDTIRQVVIHSELKEELESIGFVDNVEKVSPLDNIEDAVIVSEKPKKKRAPKKAAKAKE
ncbi:MAG: hypothetical protein Unbinned706contig1000_18 [Prokaryotic dsDNA virus sp.]|nr:MAG: hypothetical protein Unbinned706contig1000_18 [Prokaryotic dsDNA virus sp.]|tara:strand:+ start:18257 stop:18475 length:219 start_codon:yes stop_codon:yes gene_type:complete